MKSLILKSIMVTAAIGAVAGTAAAQNTMRAEIPFAFRAGGAVMQPGTYEIAIGNSAARPYPLLRNLDLKKAIYLPNFVTEYASNAMAARGAELVFDCAGSSCSLRKVWDGSGDVQVYPAPKMHGGEAVHTAVIQLTPATRAD